jgi:diguanylate cyclase (GGDEF)-like protein
MQVAVPVWSALGVGAMVSPGLVGSWIRGAGSATQLLTLLCLSSAAALTAGTASKSASTLSTRLAPTFILVAAVTLPFPAALVVGFVAVWAGGAPGVVGPRRCGSAALIGAVASLGMLQILVPRDPARSASLEGLIWILTLLFALQFVAWGIWHSSAHLTLPRRSGLDRHFVQRSLRETVNGPLAWILAGLLQRAAWSEALALGGLVLAAQWLQRRSLLALRRSNHDELDKLKTIGAAILSAGEPSRLYAIVDLECAGLFDVDVCRIALHDANAAALRQVYRHRRGAPADHTTTPLRDALTERAVRLERNIRIDDLAAHAFPDAEKRAALESGMHSALVAPLTADGRVLGALSVQSRTRAAYDDHQLALLAGVAQYAAVALNNLRHRRMATIDALTGCLAREHFMSRLHEEYRRAVRYAGRFSLLMLDLDAFKAINDSHGHLAGDRFLRETGAVIRAQLRFADSAGRYGGDEFCLLLPETGLVGAANIAERIRAAIGAQRVVCDGNTLRSTASIGLAAFPEHDNGDLRGLLRRADEALYRAKRAGRDRVVQFAA